MAHSLRMLLLRSESNPVIHTGLCDSIGCNINGPSVIAVPDWIPQRLGRFYLYFAHHNGRYIRLAYADKIEGPWRIHKPGVLPLESSHFKGHIASPDVHIDPVKRCIRLYYHGSDVETDAASPQFTRLALSADGLSFAAAAENLGAAYMRVFQWQGCYYGLAMPGVLYRSRDGCSAFEQGPTILPENSRHCAVRVEQGQLQIFYTCIGDCPESILYCEVQLLNDWHAWSASKSVCVLRPECLYEGADQPDTGSTAGIAHNPVKQLRDPALFEYDQSLYLFYSVAGEQGIAVANVTQ